MGTLALLKRTSSALALLAVMAGTARAQCPYTPTNDVTTDVESGVPLLYSAYGGNLGLFNIYWDDDWDANPANFRKADIENAMRSVLATTYFDRLCQYGVNGFHFEGGTDSADICGNDPGPTTTTPDAFAFMSCEEYTPFDNVPKAIGSPNPLTCGLCGGLPIDCFTLLDPIGTATCLATPNPTGSRIYVLFLPKGTVVDDFGKRSCDDYGAFHFQIPSRALFVPALPPVIPGTQGRPINLVMIPTECSADLAGLMANVTHEIVEAATDPLPLAHWIDGSTATVGGVFDLGHIGSLFTEGEIADICHGARAEFTATDGTSLSVDAYWSNHDNACVSLDVTPPTTIATRIPAPASGGWAATDVSVTLQATDEPTGSGVAEVAYFATGVQPIAETHVPGAVASIAISTEGITRLGFFATDIAGNVEAHRSTTVQIDKTPPVIVASAAPAANGAGWNKSDVTISFACSDALSGVASCSAPVVLTSEGTGQGATGSVVDRAGNSQTTTLTGIAIDSMVPKITCASPDTAWHATDVSIACTANDSGSGLANSSDANFTLSTSVGAGTETSTTHTGTRTVCDVAGNCAVGGPIGPIKVDKKGPSVTITAPANGSVYVLNQSVIVDFSCSDGGSGLSTCMGTVASGGTLVTSSAGSKSFTVNASDMVGNTTSGSVSYSVTYNICLLYDPTKAKKSGSTYPIQIQLCDATSHNVSASGIIVHAVSVTMASTSAPGVLDDAGNSNNPDFDFRYDSGLGGYIFNLKTTGNSTGTYNLNFTAGSDPLVHSTPFQIK